MRAPMPTPLRGFANLLEWVNLVARYAQADSVHWCTGSLLERRRLESEMIRSGGLVPAGPESHFRNFVMRSPHVVPAQPTMSASSAGAEVGKGLHEAMRGRRLYAVPYVLGSIESPLRQVGVQLTDEPAVVLETRLMARIGTPAIEAIAEPDQPIARGVHTAKCSPELGSPSSGYDPHRRFMWSFGTTGFEDRVLGYRSHALGLSDFIEEDGPRLVARMAVIGVVAPSGRRHNFAVAFPSGAGKTHLATLGTTVGGWRIDLVGDGIAWLFKGPDGRLWAMNPHRGMSTAAAHVADGRNPNLDACLRQDVLFSGVALRPGAIPWWEGREPLDEHEALSDWRGRPWMPDGPMPAAHPQARLTFPLANCPTADLTLRTEMGVPISALVFGSTSPAGHPLVVEASSWRSGIYLGATMAPEHDHTAGPALDPLWSHDTSDIGRVYRRWLSMGATLAPPPRIYRTNWFSRGPSGELLWPGFDENMRILRWIFDRIEGRGPARETPLGHVPTVDSLDVRGLRISGEALHQLMTVDARTCVSAASRHFASLAGRGLTLPFQLFEEHARVAIAMHSDLN